MNRQLSLLLNALPAIALLACAATSTNVATSWKSPAYGGMKNVLVAGIARDQATRRVFEDDFVAQLKKRGVSAVASYSIFPGDRIPSKEAVAASAKEKNIDTILMTRVVDRKDVQTYVAGGADPNSAYWSYYGLGWGYANAPGYTVVDKEVVLETNLYNAASERLEWTATSRTTTDGKNTDVIRSFIPAIVKKMAADNLF